MSYWAQYPLLKVQYPPPRAQNSLVEGSKHSKTTQTIPYTMHLPSFVQKSHQHLAKHEHQLLKATHWIMIGGSVLIAVLLGLIAYMSFLA